MATDFGDDTEVFGKSCTASSPFIQVRQSITASPNPCSTAVNPGTGPQPELKSTRRGSRLLYPFRRGSAGTNNEYASTGAGRGASNSVPFVQSSITALDTEVQEKGKKKSMWKIMFGSSPKTQKDEASLQLDAHLKAFSVPEPEIRPVTKLNDDSSLNSLITSRRSSFLRRHRRHQSRTLGSTDLVDFPVNQYGDSGKRRASENLISGSMSSISAPAMPLRDGKKSKSWYRKMIPPIKKKKKQLSLKSSSRFSLTEPQAVAFQTCEHVYEEEEEEKEDDEHLSISEAGQKKSSSTKPSQGTNRRVPSFWSLIGKKPKKAKERPPRIEEDDSLVGRLFEDQDGTGKAETTVPAPPSLLELEKRIRIEEESRLVKIRDETKEDFLNALRDIQKRFFIDQGKHNLWKYQQFKAVLTPDPDSPGAMKHGIQDQELDVFLEAKKTQLKDEMAKSLATCKMMNQISQADNVHDLRRVDWRIMHTQDQLDALKVAYLLTQISHLVQDMFENKSFRKQIQKLISKTEDNVEAWVSNGYLDLDHAQFTKEDLQKHSQLQHGKLILEHMNELVYTAANAANGTYVQEMTKLSGDIDFLRQKIRLAIESSFDRLKYVLPSGASSSVESEFSSFAVPRSLAGKLRVTEPSVAIATAEDHARGDGKKLLEKREMIVRRLIREGLRAGDGFILRSTREEMDLMERRLEGKWGSYRLFEKWMNDSVRWQWQDVVSQSAIRKDYSQMESLIESKKQTIMDLVERRLEQLWMGRAVGAKAENIDRLELYIREAITRRPVVLITKQALQSEIEAMQYEEERGQICRVFKGVTGRSIIRSGGVNGDESYPNDLVINSADDISRFIVVLQDMRKIISADITLVNDLETQTIIEDMKKETQRVWDNVKAIETARQTRESSIEKNREKLIKQLNEANARLKLEEEKLNKTETDGDKLQEKRAELDAVLAEIEVIKAKQIVQDELYKSNKQRIKETEQEVKSNKKLLASLTTKYKLGSKKLSAVKSKALMTQKSDATRKSELKKQGRYVVEPPTTRSRTQPDTYMFEASQDDSRREELSVEEIGLDFNDASQSPDLSMWTEADLKKFGEVETQKQTTIAPKLIRQASDDVRGLVKWSPSKSKKSAPVSLGDPYSLSVNKVNPRAWNSVEAGDNVDNSSSGDTMIARTKKKPLWKKIVGTKSSARRKTGMAETTSDIGVPKEATCSDLAVEPKQKQKKSWGWLVGSSNKSKKHTDVEILDDMSDSSSHRNPLQQEAIIPKLPLKKCSVPINYRPRRDSSESSDGIDQSARFEVNRQYSPPLSTSKVVTSVVSPRFGEAGQTKPNGSEDFAQTSEHHDKNNVEITQSQSPESIRRHGQEPISTYKPVSLGEEWQETSLEEIKCRTNEDLSEQSPFFDTSQSPTGYTSGSVRLNSTELKRFNQVAPQEKFKVHEDSYLPALVYSKSEIRKPASTQPEIYVGRKTLPEVFNVAETFVERKPPETDFPPANSNLDPRVSLLQSNSNRSLESPSLGIEYHQSLRRHDSATMANNNAPSNHGATSRRATERLHELSQGSEGDSSRVSNIPKRREPAALGKDSDRTDDESRKPVAFRKDSDRTDDESRKAVALERFVGRTSEEPRRSHSRFRSHARGLEAVLTNMDHSRSVSANDASGRSILSWGSRKNRSSSRSPDGRASKPLAINRPSKSEMSVRSSCSSPGRLLLGDILSVWIVTCLMDDEERSGVERQADLERVEAGEVIWTENQVMDRVVFVESARLDLEDTESSVVSGNVLFAGDYEELFSSLEFDGKMRVGCRRVVVGVSGMVWFIPTRVLREAIWSSRGRVHQSLCRVVKEIPSLRNLTWTEVKNFVHDIYLSPLIMTAATTMHINRAQRAGTIWIVWSGCVVSTDMMNEKIEQYHQLDIFNAEVMDIVTPIEDPGPETIALSAQVHPTILYPVSKHQVESHVKQTLEEIYQRYPISNRDIPVILAANMESVSVIGASSSHKSGCLIKKRKGLSGMLNQSAKFLRIKKSTGKAAITDKKNLRPVSEEQSSSIG